jgi:site-specific DNA recombinase
MKGKNMEEKNLIVIYSRVSSAAQSLELQLSSARRYLESEGLTGKEDFVIELSDHDVSATKLKISQRPKLTELIKLIKEGKVKKVIGYKRDRFARNFYEFVEITKIFIEYGVDVVYTASNEHQFQNKLALEAFYGIFGHMEGDNIRTRTNDARKQYPSSIFGYTRLKEQGQVSFVINEDKQESIVALFTEFSHITSEDQFLEFLMKRRKGINKPEKILRILTNPFYAAHFESKNAYQALPHVEAMISIELFIKVKSKIDDYLGVYEEKLNERQNHFNIAPLCGKCGNVMKHRTKNALDAGYFVCSDSHKKVMITVEELNNSLEQSVLDYVQSIAEQLAHRIMSKNISSANKRLQNEQDIASSEYLETTIELSTLDQKAKSSLSRYLDQIQKLKDKFNLIGQDLVALQVLSNEIKNIDNILSLQKLSFSEHEVRMLVELLVDKILVHETHIQIDLFLSEFAKEANIA